MMRTSLECHSPGLWLAELQHVFVLEDDAEIKCHPFKLNGPLVLVLIGTGDTKNNVEQRIDDRLLLPS